MPPTVTALPGFRKNRMNRQDIDTLVAWCTEKQITEVECMIPDLAGVARGKILPVRKFLDGLTRDSHHLPESIFIQTITGEYPDLEDEVVPVIDRDVVLHPDPATIRMVPWYQEPTAQIICDCYYPDGQAVAIYTREVLRRVVALYHQRGWSPIVAPELEFYLVDINRDPNTPLKTPIGRNGRPETARQSYGIDAVNEFDPVFEDVYDFCEAQAIDIDTLNHESGAAQIEINFMHGAPLELADQAFLFKRTVRQTAFRHDIYATFMASPMQHEPGSSMHIHSSIKNKKTGKNIFVNDDGSDSDAFYYALAGMQRYLVGAMALMAPYVNSYRRRTGAEDSPANLAWGVDNRTVGLRVPFGEQAHRRIENRIPGADANPYLAIAATLAAIWLGLQEDRRPTKPRNVSGEGLETLPKNLDVALDVLEKAKALHPVLGEEFVKLFVEVKRTEADEFLEVISPWEREYLLLNV